jgi:hypothetical protein
MIITKFFLTFHDTLFMVCTVLRNAHLQSQKQITRKWEWPQLLKPIVHYTVYQTRDAVTRYLTLRYTELNVYHSLPILLTGSFTSDTHFSAYSLLGEVTMLSKTETRVKSHSQIHLLSYQRISVLHQCSADTQLPAVYASSQSYRVQL